MNEKTKYRLLCKEEPSIPIFSQDWWLDVTCGVDNWDVVLCEKDNQVIASMPFYTINRRFATHIGQPKLTAKLGPWIKPNNSNYFKKLANEKDIFFELIEKLPKFDVFIQCWDSSMSNWLPFKWKGFKQTTNYTYTIDCKNDIDVIFKKFQSNIRTDIKKALERFNLSIIDNPSIMDFLKLNNMTFERQGMKPPYSDVLVQEIYKTCLMKNVCKIIIVQDELGKHHAGVFLVEDNTTIYYIMGGSNPELRNSGAMSLCIWEAIKYTATKGKIFDFEGSMIEQIERFVRAFGAQQISYSQISKINSKWIVLRNFLTDFRK